MKMTDQQTAVDEKWRVMEVPSGRTGIVIRRLGITNLMVSWDRARMPPYNEACDHRDLVRLDEAG